MLGQRSLQREGREPAAAVGQGGFTHRLLVAVVMHVKYMHEHCSVLMYIPTYYNVISCYIHDLWGFIINLPCFGYNSVEQENPILCIFTFQNLPELKLTWDFSGVNILS
jgi:hypothetical protein